MVLTRIGPVSVAKVALVLYAAIGFVVGCAFTVASLFGAAMSVASGDESAFVGVLFGVGAIVAFPLLYGVLGAVSALIAAVLFNLATGVTGGIELTLKEH